MSRSLSVVPTLLLTALAIATALTLPVPVADAIPMTFVGDLAGANEVSSCRFARSGPRSGSAGPDGTNDTDKRRVFRLDVERHRGAHPLLRTTRHQRRGRHHASCVSWVPVGSDLRDLHLPCL